MCTGTYNLGETSQAQAPPSRSKSSETPPSRVTSAKLGVTTPPKSPSKSLFTNLVLGSNKTPAAPLVTTRVTPSKVIHLGSLSYLQLPTCMDLCSISCPLHIVDKKMGFMVCAGCSRHNCEQPGFKPRTRISGFKCSR